jgi:hypothetical protein
MISPQQIQRADAERVALSGLRSFFDTQYVSKLLSDKHAVSAKDKHLVTLQAESIRHCLQQAIEYRDAALASTFSRPTLTYYSIMSLALCEILFKRDGTYRLAKLRERHGHHGLELMVQLPRALRGEIPLGDLSARRLQKGTFPVWYETARASGTFGEHSERRTGGFTTGLQALSQPVPLSGLPERLTLMDLACCCPTIHAESDDLGIQSRLARATITSLRNYDTNVLDVIIHPTPADLFDQIGKNITFSVRCADLVAPKDFESGGGFRIEHPADANYIEGRFPLNYTLETGHTLLSTEEVLLNEFGIYYVASYVSGMFARYYPEYWARGVENSNQTFRVIDALMSHALSRTPLLLLGELRDKYYIYFK